MNKNIFKIAAIGLALLSSGQSMNAYHLASPIYAQEKKSPSNTHNGVVNVGKGDKNILIKPSESQPLTGKTFKLYKLLNAEYFDEEDAYIYSCTKDSEAMLKKMVAEEFKMNESDISEGDVISFLQDFNYDQSRYRAIIEKIFNTIQKVGLEGEEIVIGDADSNGNVKITGLDYGLYLLDDTTNANGLHHANSSLMSITSDSEAELRLKASHPEIIKKVKEDDEKYGWNDIGDFEYGQDIPFSIKMSIPNFSLFEKYKLVVHDKMDKGLVLKDNSVKVTLTMPNKKYVIDPKEYKLEKNIEGDTFRVTFDDFKKTIMDLCAPVDTNLMDQLQMYMEIECVGLFDDEIKDLLGRPGLENQAKISYSNDPNNLDGSMGESPWDSVVCFTYGIDGIKKNNEGISLSNAHFRLYRDKECKNPIFIKQIKNDYFVVHEDQSKSIDMSQSAEITSDSNGKFSIYGLDQGEYWIKEVKAPKGYRGLDRPIKLKINATMTEDRDSYLTGQGSLNYIFNELLVDAYFSYFNRFGLSENKVQLISDADKGIANLEVINIKGKKLPVTGSSTALVCTLIPTVILMYFYKKRKNN